MMLHLGRVDDSAKVYERLIGKAQETEEELIDYYLGLSACEDGRNERSEAMRTLQKAGTAIERSRRALPQGLGAARLNGFYRHTGVEDEVGRWEEFLSELSCPEETKQAMRKRADFVCERCKNEGRLILV